MERETKESINKTKKSGISHGEMTGGRRRLLLLTAAWPMVAVLLSLLVSCGGGGKDSFWNGGGSTTPPVAFTVLPASATITSTQSAAFTAYGGTAPYSVVTDSTAVTISPAVVQSDGGTFVVTPVSGQITAATTINITVRESGGTTVAVVVNVSAKALAVTPSSAAITSNQKASFTVTGGVPPYSLALDNVSIATLSASSLSSSGSNFTVSPIPDAITSSVSAVVTIRDSADNTMSVTVTMSPATAPQYTMYFSPATVSYIAARGDAGTWRKQYLVMQLVDSFGNPGKNLDVDVYFAYKPTSMLDVVNTANASPIDTYGTVSTDSSGKAKLEVDFYTKDYLSYQASLEARHTSAVASVAMDISSDTLKAVTMAITPPSYTHTTTP